MKDHMPRHHRRSPQITVVVSISSSPGVRSVTYSYVDPGGELPPKPTTCIITAIPPYDIVYVLDYTSTKAGWSFTKHVEPTKTSLRIAYYRAVNRLSMTTRYKEIDTDTYSYYLLFKNRLTNEKCYSDPQEGNMTPTPASAPSSPPAPQPTAMPIAKARVSGKKAKS